MTKPLRVTTNLRKNNSVILSRIQRKRGYVSRIIYSIFIFNAISMYEGISNRIALLPSSVKFIFSALILSIFIIEIIALITVACLINDKCFYTYFGV